jgi:hypothetical protein
MLVVTYYVFYDKEKINERAADFLEFNHLTSSKRAWTEKTFSGMIETLPESLFTSHKKLYRSLSSFAHPTMMSFRLNAHGDEREFGLILLIVYQAFLILLEILKFFCERKLFFANPEDTLKMLTKYNNDVSIMMKKMEQKYVKNKTDNGITSEV